MDLLHTLLVRLKKHSTFDDFFLLCTALLAVLMFICGVLYSLNVPILVIACYAAVMGFWFQAEEVKKRKK